MLFCSFADPDPGWGKMRNRFRKKIRDKLLGLYLRELSNNVLSLNYKIFGKFSIADSGWKNRDPSQIRNPSLMYVVIFYLKRYRLIMF
jgi:hypothetical protein